MASSSKDLEDYWAEFKTIEQANLQVYEDDISKTPDEGEAEAAWLDAAGFQSLVTKYKDGSDLSQDDLDSLTDTLTQAQAETVRKRVNALSTTMRKKNKASKPHVKDIFPSLDDPSKDYHDDAVTNDQLPSSPSSLADGQNTAGQHLPSSPQHRETGNNRGTSQDGVRRAVGKLCVRHSFTTQNSSNQLASLMPRSDLNIDLEFHLQERKKPGCVFGPVTLDTDNIEMPVFEPKPDPLGVTLISDLAECDMERIKSLAHIELTTLFDHYNIIYTRPKRKRKVKEHGIFGVPLEVLVEHDQKRSPETTVPIVFETMISFLEKEGLYAEGILRVSRAETRTKQLRQDLQEKFYQGLFSWGDAGPHDVAVVFKQFLRELPIPLLSYNYLDAFMQISNIPKILEQLKALNLLILLLTKEHRNTLKVLLVFLRNIISHSDQNKMSLNNVAMIMAPNLFLAPHRSNKEKADLDLELKKAAGTSNIVKMLIHYQDVLWTIPSAFIAQLRHQYTTDANRKSRISKLLWKKNKEKSDVSKKQIPTIDQSENKEGMIRVQTPHLNKGPTLIQLDQVMTAADVVAKVTGVDGSQPAESSGQLENNEHTHGTSNEAQSISEYLFEVGGNIGERCLDPSTKVMEVHLINPHAEWVVKTRLARPQALFTKEL